MSVIDDAVAILLDSSGLDPEQAKLAVYYAAATWKLPHLDIFPILRFCGPPGSGKTKAMEVLTVWCREPKRMSGKLITAASLRDELGRAYMGTAIIDEADETADSKTCEELLAARCSPLTGQLEVKRAEKYGGWRQEAVEIFGASIVHYRRAFMDQATASRSITINTRCREGSWQPLTDIPELPALARLADISPRHDISELVPDGRVKDVWSPLLHIASVAKDYDWLDHARKVMESELEELRDGHTYELPGLILAQIITALTERKENERYEICCRQLQVQEDIVIPLRHEHRVYIHPWQASRQLKEMGFELQRIGGRNKFIPTLDSLKRAAEKIGYRDSLLD